MSELTAALHPSTRPPASGSPAAAARSAGPLGRAARDVGVLTWRNLLHIAREPLQLSDITVQPVLFTLLFIYVLGSGVRVAGGDYADFAIAGLVSLNLTTSAMGTAVGLSNDLGTGVVERFRTLPMWRAAVLVSRSLSDLLAAGVCLSIVLLTGLAVGWRPDTSP
ncbi:ABC transporter permease, partial [Frankia sp. EI5c]|uniref:ABC transporter permease n=1 Tax=Frankia sp. EI5c TaxID=683316 RepID=UPI001F5B885D